MIGKKKQNCSCEHLLERKRWSIRTKEPTWRKSSMNTPRLGKEVWLRKNKRTNFFTLELSLIYPNWMCVVCGNSIPSDVGISMASTVSVASFSWIQLRKRPYVYDVFFASRKWQKKLVCFCLSWQSNENFTRQDDSTAIDVVVDIKRLTRVAEPTHELREIPECAVCPLSSSRGLWEGLPSIRLYLSNTWHCSIGC